MKENTTSANYRWGLFKKKQFPMQGCGRLLFISIVLFVLLLSCDNDNLYFEELKEETEGVGNYLNPDLQPFAAWLRIGSPSLRSSIDPEIAEMIELEKGLFDSRYSYVEEFFKIIPDPRWQAFKMIQYDDDILDIFVPCVNIYPGKIEENDFVLVISKRGGDVFSTLKMLPRDESLSDRLTVFYHEDKVYLEVGYTDPDGATISQNMGYISRDKSGTDAETRSSGCIGDGDKTFGSMVIRRDGDGFSGVVTITRDDHNLNCGGGGGHVDAPLPGYVNTPGAAGGAGGIPPYAPPSSSGSGGSSGSGSSSNSGGNYLGGSGSSGSGNPGGSGNLGGGGGSSSYPDPMFPKGGLDIIPMPEFEGKNKKPASITVTLSQLIKSHSLTDQQLSKLDIALGELIKEGCMQKALYDALVSKNVKLNFGMAAGVTAPASYDPRDRSIKFKNNNSITKDNLKEELFHAWQDAFYSGGIWQYRETGKVNIEFEAKVFKDIARNLDYGCCYIFGEDHIPRDINIEYNSWIESIQSNPGLLLNEDYRRWLDLFNQYYPNYSSPKNNNLSLPSSLDKLINTSNCF